MKLAFLSLCLLTISLSSCKKNSYAFAEGTVINQSGCFSDYYLVSIDNPDFSKHDFLRPSLVSSCVTCYNCSNSAYVQLPASLAAPGTRIRFLFAESMASCLSFSEAPAHIKVRSIMKL